MIRLHLSGRLPLFHPWGQEALRLLWTRHRIKERRLRISFFPPLIIFSPQSSGL
uniref:Xenopus laevis XlHbox1 protein (PR I type) n=1 Tax=Xenopus laevis TaxID=8355 RepID=Q91762_XENLA|nr:unnamed protein product [Xenopus laevis]